MGAFLLFFSPYWDLFLHVGPFFLWLSPPLRKFMVAPITVPWIFH